MAYTIELLDNKTLQEKLTEQGKNIGNDVNETIDDFIANTNSDIARRILRAIKAYHNPEEGFTAFKEFIQSGDDVKLRASIQKQKISFLKTYGLVNEQVKTVQRRVGQDPSSLTASFKRVAHIGIGMVAARFMANNTRGKMTYGQQCVFEPMLAMQRLCDGPALVDPFTNAMAPHVRKAVNEKLLQSYDSLKSHVNKPLVDEGTIRSVHDDVLTTATEKFTRLLKQTYSDSESIMPAYGFKAAQMPEGTKFGIELEGTVPLVMPFPLSLFKISGLLREFGLAAGVALISKQDTKFEKWSITTDSSVISPLHFTGRYNSMNQMQGGMEIVSPILRGPNGQKSLMLATSALATIQFKSNESCGLHMHISLEDTTLDQKKNLVKALYHNEEALDQLIHPDRRGDVNVYSHSVRGMNLADVDAATTTEELVEVLNPGKDRNHKFDMTGLVLAGAPPTLQYRAAGGAGYLNTTGDYAVILGNFTKEALDNPLVRVENIIAQLVSQKAALEEAKNTATEPVRIQTVTIDQPAPL